MRNYDDYDEDYNYFEEERSYDHYNGSYAQDVEDWSDQDIYDVLMVILMHMEYWLKDNL